MVRIYTRGVDGWSWVTGVIVAADGEILTCAHHDLPIGTRVVVALGVFIDASGLLMTKRSEIVGRKQLTCRLADGSEAPARMIGESTEHDLALLAAEGARVQPAKWSDMAGVAPGDLVASVGRRGSVPRFGVVCASRISNPGVRGRLPINGLEKTPDGESGLAVTEVWARRPDVGDLRTALRAGDFIVALNGRATQTIAEFVRIRSEILAARETVIGERVVLSVRRGSERTTVLAPLV